MQSVNGLKEPFYYDSGEKFLQPMHHLPALIYGFFGEKKIIKFLFPPPRKKTLHVLICSVNLAIHQF
jgi:hypothetical protein